MAERHSRHRAPTRLACITGHGQLISLPCMAGQFNATGPSPAMLSYDPGDKLTVYGGTGHATGPSPGRTQLHLRGAAHRDVHEPPVYRRQMFMVLRGGGIQMAMPPTLLLLFLLLPPPSTSE